MFEIIKVTAKTYHVSLTVTMKQRCILALTLCRSVKLKC